MEQQNSTKPAMALSVFLSLPLVFFFSLSRKLVSGLGAKLNNSASHSFGRPAATPKPIALSTYGAATTVRPSFIAGVISQRSRNSRSEAYSSSRVLGVGVKVLALPSRSSKKVPDASHRLQAGSPRPRHRRANRSASSCTAGPFVPSRATSLPMAPVSLAAFLL